MKFVIALAFAGVLLAGCSDSSTEPATSNDGGQTDSGGSTDGGSGNEVLQELMVSGGTASSPTTLDLSSRHEIDSNSFYNYFTYNAQAGEKLFLQSVLDRPMTSQEISRCNGYGGSASGIHIYIYDLNMNPIRTTCGKSLAYTFEQDGTYIVHFRYADIGISGYFNASSLLFSGVSGAGSPSDPSALSLSLENEINSNSFYNYFTYNAQAGEKLFLQSVLDRPMTSQEISRCNGYGGSASGIHIYIYDLNMNPIRTTCGKSLAYTFEQDGTYIVHFRYADIGISGYFNAASIQ